MLTNCRDALWKATASDRNSLFKAMETFRAKLIKKEASISNVDLQACTWKDAMEEFDRAWKYYDIERHKGVARSMYTAFRKLGENAKSFENWLNLLPSGDYGSPICGMPLVFEDISETEQKTLLTGSIGAFKLILGVSEKSVLYSIHHLTHHVFQAAGRLHGIRSSTYEALQDIPETVSNARRYLKVYSDSRAFELSQKTAKLFSAVLKSLEAIITNLTDHGFSKSPKRKI